MNIAQIARASTEALNARDEELSLMSNGDIDEALLTEWEAVGAELDARDRDASDPAVRGELEHRQDMGDAYAGNFHPGWDGTIWI